MTEEQMGATGAHDRGVWTIGRKLNALVLITVLVGIAGLAYFNKEAARESAMGQATKGHASVTELLATSVSGGVRWKKADAVDNILAPIVAAEGSEIAGLRVYTADGAALTAHMSDGTAIDVTAVLDAVALGEGVGTTAVVYGDGYHTVLVPVLLAGAEAPIGALAVVWDLSALYAELDRAVVLTAVAGLVALAGVALVLAVGAGRMVGRPLATIADVMGRMSGGDLTSEVPYADKRDEVGAMAAALKVFKENARQLEAMQAEQEALKVAAEQQREAAMAEMAEGLRQRVSALINDMSGMVTSLGERTEQMSTTASSTSDLSMSVAAVTAETTHNVQAVAAAIEELHAASSNISQHVGGTANDASAAVEQAQRAQQTVSGLAEAVERIGAVVEMIQSISQQTNLLALNATIEAARAGEAGKGFAVVAGEVKNLATQAANATDEINAQIEAVKAETDRAVDVISQIGGMIDHLRKGAVEVASTVSQQDNAINEIARNVQDAARGTQDAADQIDGFSANAGTTRDAAGAVAEISAQLQDGTAKLDRTVRQYVEEMLRQGEPRQAAE